jgi:hypothetical protein
MIFGETLFKYTQALLLLFFGVWIGIVAGGKWGASGGRDNGLKHAVKQSMGETKTAMDTSESKRYRTGSRWTVVSVELVA